MNKFFGMIIFLLLTVNVSAIDTNVTVISDEVYTGAILKVRSLGSEETIGRYYPFFIGANIGIIKFEIKSELSEVNFSLRFSKGGEAYPWIEGGRFAINGSEIIWDLRKVENVSTDELIKNVSIINVSKETIIETSSKIDEEVISVNKYGFLGHVSKNYGLAQNNIYILVVLGIIFTGIFLSLIVRSAYKSGAKAELKGLGRIEIDKHLDKLDS